MKAKCEVCGKPIDVLSWDRKICYSCRKAEYAAEIKRQITSGEKTEVDCESEIYCPYCGEEIELEPCDDSDILYCDGEHEVECPLCEKVFIVNTSVSYSYDTSRKDEK